MRLIIPLCALLAMVLAACGAPLPAEPNGEPDLPEPTPPPASYYGGTITLELVAPSEVRQGERLEGLDVVITNHNDEPFDFYYSGDLVDFEVLDAEGNRLWRHLQAYVQPLLMGSLGAGESKAISTMDLGTKGSWDLRDEQGLPVSAGMYYVRGIMNFSLEDPGPGTEYERLETALHPFVVREAGLPDYAQAIEIELTAPREALRGGAISMDMYVTNTGNKPVVLWWSGGSVIPRPNFMDIVILEDDEPTWRATSAHGVEGQGHVILAAGETRTMSSLFEGYGDAWEWDMRADCGEFRFEPCDAPVAPGTYTIRGVVNVSPPDVLEQEPPFTPERTALATEPHQLVLTE